MNKRTKRNYGEKYYEDLPGKYDERFLPDTRVSDGPYSITVTHGFEDIVVQTAYITGAIVSMGKKPMGDDRA